MEERPNRRFGMRSPPFQEQSNWEYPTFQSISSTTEQVNQNPPAQISMPQAPVESYRPINQNLPAMIRLSMPQAPFQSRQPVREFNRPSQMPTIDNLLQSRQVHAHQQYQPLQNNTTSNQMMPQYQMVPTYSPMFTPKYSLSEVAQPHHSHNSSQQNQEQPQTSGSSSYQSGQNLPSFQPSTSSHQPSNAGEWSQAMIRSLRSQLPDFSLPSTSFSPPASSLPSPPSSLPLPRSIHFNDMRDTINKYTAPPHIAEMKERLKERYKQHSNDFHQHQRFLRKMPRSFGSFSGPDRTRYMPNYIYPTHSSRPPPAMPRIQTSDEPISSTSGASTSHAVSGTNFSTSAAPSSPRYASQQPAPPKIVPSPSQECIVCNELCSAVVFLPCLHKICCAECGQRMKKCIKCQIVIEKRVAPDGKVLDKKEPAQAPSADRLRYLESKIMEIEEIHCCSICMERRRNVAFLCGHSACSECAQTLKTCHMCRQTISKKINLY